jgi:uncharacterized protein YgiM (DUF1202 family)
MQKLKTVARTAPRRLIAVLLTSALLVGLTAVSASPAQAATTQYKVVNVKTSVNFRQSASESSTILCTVAKGKVVDGTGKTSGNWIQVKATCSGKSKTGWISKNYLEKVKATPAKPTKECNKSGSKSVDFKLYEFPGPIGDIAKTIKAPNQTLVTITNEFTYCLTGNTVSDVKFKNSYITNVMFMSSAKLTSGKTVNGASFAQYHVAVKVPLLGNTLWWADPWTKCSPSGCTKGWS